MIFTLLASLAAAAISPAPASRTVAWTELTVKGLEARTVAFDGLCPAARIDGRGAVMTIRAQAQPGFQGAVCAMAVPASAKSLTVGGAVLPVLRRLPMRIVVLGDTGCRVKGTDTQDCNDSEHWPFPTIARLAAAQRPDLVIHIGDYVYRETPCPPRRAGCVGSPFGDNWPTWDADLFQPAAPLLAAAPWVFARGNHESCARAATGWFRILDPAPRPLTCPALSPAFEASLGDMSLFVLDSSEANDNLAVGPDVTDLSKAVDGLGGALAHHPGWIVTHRPIWALAPISHIGPVWPLEIGLNATEQRVLDARDLSGVGLVLSGHVHHFAAYSFGRARPPQLIIGTGGDLRAFHDPPYARDPDVALDGLPATSLTISKFGYLVLDRVAGGWSGAFRGLHDEVIATCSLHQRQLTCASTSGAQR